MGSGRDKRKKAKPKAAGAGVAKTERKTEQNANKQERRLERQAQGGEDDLDSLLARFKLDDQQRSAVRVEEDCAPPTPRVYASFTPIHSQKVCARVLEGCLQGAAWHSAASPARACGSTKAHRCTLQENEVCLFGGEWYDHKTDKTFVYCDLYVLNVEKQTWRRVVSPSGPLPRTSHQAVCTRSALWVFGGEFTSLSQVRCGWMHRGHTAARRHGMGQGEP